MAFLPSQYMTNMVNSLVDTVKSINWPSSMDDGAVQFLDYMTPDNLKLCACVLGVCLFAHIAYIMLDHWSKPVEPSQKSNDAASEAGTPRYTTRSGTRSASTAGNIPIMTPINRTRTASYGTPSAAAAAAAVAASTPKTPSVTTESSIYSPHRSLPTVTSKPLLVQYGSPSNATEIKLSDSDAKRLTNTKLRFQARAKTLKPILSNKEKIFYKDYKDNQTRKLYKSPRGLTQTQYVESFLNNTQAQATFDFYANAMHQLCVIMAENGDDHNAEDIANMEILLSEIFDRLRMANGVIATYQATDNYYVKPMIDFMLANNLCLKN
jgi:hypothetical protein